MMDAVTGQYYLRARFYNPVIARFLSEDTYYGDGLNLYAYCHNNPVGYVDPSGHICEEKYNAVESLREQDGSNAADALKKYKELREQGYTPEQIKNGDYKSGKTTVIYGTDDIANYQYNIIENPGPLAEMPNQPVKNFYGGRYNVEVLQEDRIMYRAGNSQNPYGRWFTSEPPASVANVRIDTAVKTHWIDPKTGAYEASSYIDNVYAIKVPKGTTIYTGPVGPQGGVYVGGYNVMQTYIDAPWTFEVVGKTQLR